MNYSHTLRPLAALGLSALALAGLAPASRALTVGPGANVYNLQSTGTISFNTLPGVTGPTTLEFIFGPGANFAPAEMTASSFNYTGNWSPDAVSLILNANTPTHTDFQGHLSYALDARNQISTISLYNNGTPSTVVPSFFSAPVITSPDDGILSQTQTTSSITIPFSSVGTGASFQLQYLDPPASATFQLLEGGQTLLAGTFDPSGNFTPTIVAPGVTTTLPAATAVPEPSSLALLGLGALPLLGLARRRA